MNFGRDPPILSSEQETVRGGIDRSRLNCRKRIAEEGGDKNGICGGEPEMSTRQGPHQGKLVCSA